MTRNPAKNILFVCTGNSCRSIMAEAYFAKRIAEEQLEVEVKSAGTIGVDGMLPADNTIEMLEEEGIDTAGYASTALDHGIINWADAILVMEPRHAEGINTIVPEAEMKTFYLAEFNKNATSPYIPDPIGRAVAYYRESFSVIKKSVEGLIEWLKN
jgi:protein arginine phosphatase